MKTNNYSKNEKLNNFYAVTAKCGHSGYGRKAYVPINFDIIASSGKEAARIARQMPRCKRHHADAILEVKKITQAEYNELRKTNSEDMYLSVQNIQDQRRFVDMSERIIWEKEEMEYDKKPGDYTCKTFKKENIRKPKKYFSKYYHDDTADDFLL